MLKLPRENERLQELIDKYCNGNQKSFADFIGIAQPSINRLFRIDKLNDEVPSVLKSKAVLQKIQEKIPSATVSWFKGSDEKLQSAKKTPKLVSLYTDGIEGFANDDAIIEWVISNEKYLLANSTKFQIYFENIRLRAQKEVLMATGN